MGGQLSRLLRRARPIEAAPAERAMGLERSSSRTGIRPPRASIQQPYSNTPMDPERARSKVLKGLKELHGASADIDQQPYFYGQLPRNEVVAGHFLQEDGDFLIRESENSRDPIVISVQWKGEVQHIPVKLSVDEKGRSWWSLGGKKFEQLIQLIYHYVDKGKAVTRCGAMIRYPVAADCHQLKNDDVALIRKIGEGNFGEVWQGALTREGYVMDVAVKRLKIEEGKISAEEKKKFLKEARIMKSYSHPNVAQFVGIGVKRQPFLLVMEFVKGGGLDDYLKDLMSDHTESTLLGFCMDAARGMAYLESRKCIHRDLAARNCLLTSKTPPIHLKISDFGMSREGNVYLVKKTRALPIRWTAPEGVLKHQFTTKSDVWSYGILLWKVYMNAELPYPDIDSNRQVILRLVEGYRMDRPESMPDELARIMSMCWEMDPVKRPCFSDLDRLYQAMTRSGHY